MFNNVEFKANQLLDMAECNDVPVDIHEIARRCSYNIRSYSACKTLIKKLSAEDIINKYPSVSFLYDGAYYILLSDDLTKDQEAKLIAHEIGHIKLHNLHGYDISRLHGDSAVTEVQEAEADEFALYLLAPLVLLSRHKIKNPSSIKELTGLSLNDCRTVFEKLREYRDECCVINSRNRLLERCKNATRLNYTPKTVLTVLICAIVLLMCTLPTLNYEASSTAPQNTYINVVTEASDNSSCSESAQQTDVSATVSSNYHKGNETSLHQSSMDVSCVSMTDRVAESDTTQSPSHITTYYWTDSGTVYHSYENCRSLKNSTEIRSGTLPDAQSTKPRLCKFCEDKMH